MDLFGESDEHESDPIELVADDAPLAERMRPRNFAEFVGQQQLVDEDRVIRRLLKGELRQSLILWGPPGAGKTTLARLVAAESKMRFVPFSAVVSGIKEVRAVMAESEKRRKRTGTRTLLFVDEIHRFNKAQQDAFLPYVERGDILLIGATTENPSFEIVSPLLSRSRTLVLEPLSPEDLCAILRRALEDAERGLNGAVEVSDDLLMTMAHACDGDARRALTLLETAASFLPDGGALDMELLAEALQKKQLAYDKNGEQHYDLISALHKSIRNGDANASIYWITRMLESGEDRRFLLRRLIRMAIEDIGLADPFALRVALDADETWRRLGDPEGELALVQAAVYL
ncbi:MAG: putative ATPase, partial [Planctomycetota bacterium]